MTDIQEPGDETPAGSPQSADDTCPVCAGSGLVDSQPCTNCGGSGLVTVIVGDA